eukprot:scaffold1293_cov68-Skeletonema_dohrnii-CCMP3373.AAC.1
MRYWRRRRWHHQVTYDVVAMLICALLSEDALNSFYLTKKEIVGLGRGISRCCARSSLFSSYASWEEFETILGGKPIFWAGNHDAWCLGRSWDRVGKDGHGMSGQKF